MEGIQIITYQHARRFLGHVAHVHCRGGVTHYGVISRVTPEHLHIQPHPVGLVSSDKKNIEIDTLESNTDAELQTVQWGYGRAAVTTLALYDVLAISLFAW